MNTEALGGLQIIIDKPRKAKVVLVEMPNVNLVRERDGINIAPNVPDAPNGSKQYTATSLDGRFDVSIVDLKRTKVLTEDGHVRKLHIEEEEYGRVDWEGDQLIKVRWGNRNFDEALREAADQAASTGGVVGFTANFLKERGLIMEATRKVIDMTNGRARVIVGGRDAFAEPFPYLSAGADAVVKNMDGDANQAIVEYVTGQKVSRPLETSDVVFNLEKLYFPYEERTDAGPSIQIIPPRWIIRETMGTQHTENPLPDHLNKLGAFKKIWKEGEKIILKSPCDENCIFCTVPLFGRPDLNRLRFDLEDSLEYIRALKRGGVRTISFLDDQLLLDVLYPGGEKMLIEFFDSLRKEGLAWVMGNGIQIKKFTVSKGIGTHIAENRYYKERIEQLKAAGETVEPGNYQLDERLVKAVCGWDPEAIGWDGTKGVGCIAVYWPGEDPTGGEKAKGMRKLLDANDQLNALREIFRISGMTRGSYGMIYGRHDQTAEHMMANTEAALRIKDALLEDNPNIEFIVTPFALVPATGTPAAYTTWKQLERIGVASLYKENPELAGNFWTPKPTKLVTARTISEAQLDAFRRANRDIRFGEPWHGMDDKK